MKQFNSTPYDAVGVEATLGLVDLTTREQFTTKHVTEYLLSLEKETPDKAGFPLTFEVYSGYVPCEGTVDNVALLRASFGRSTYQTRIIALQWYMEKLMDKFGQVIAYAQVSTSNFHGRIIFTLAEQEKEPPIE